MRTERKLLQDAVDATVSTDMNINGASRVTLHLQRSNHSSGNTVFTVLVSVDGANFITYNKLVDNTTDNNAKTRVASVTLSSNTFKVYSLDFTNDVFSDMRVTATRTTDGKSTVVALVEYAY